MNNETNCEIRGCRSKVIRKNAEGCGLLVGVELAKHGLQKEPKIVFRRFILLAINLDKGVVQKFWRYFGYQKVGIFVSSDKFRFFTLRCG